MGELLAELRWPEAEVRLAGAAAVVLPVAAGAKQHGRHLPLGTDALVADYLVQQLLHGADVVVAPPILHGWFPAFAQWPGTQVADAGVFGAYVRAVAESLLGAGARRLLLLNLGVAGATGLPLAIVARELVSAHGVPVLLLSWDDLEDEAARALCEQERGGHADEAETSIMLHLAPQAVVLDGVRADYRDPVRRQPPAAGYRPGTFSRDPRSPEYSADGHFGDPQLASAAKGERLLAAMTGNLLAALAAFVAEPAGSAR